MKERIYRDQMKKLGIFDQIYSECDNSLRSCPECGRNFGSHRGNGCPYPGTTNWPIEDLFKLKNPLSLDKILHILKFEGENG